METASLLIRIRRPASVTSMTSVPGRTGSVPATVRALASAERDVGYAGTAAPGDPVVERRGALAEAGIRHREQQFLAQRHLGKALRRETSPVSSVWASSASASASTEAVDVLALGAAPGRCAAQEAGPLMRRRFHVLQHGQADHQVVPAAQADAAHAGAVASGEHADRVVGDLEADAAATAGGEEHVVALRGRSRRPPGGRPRPASSR